MRLKPLILTYHPPIVSIHASVKDATRASGCPVPSIRGFNPRICKRCDQEHWENTKLKLCFNPRICKRCDWLRLIWQHVWACFNPRICKRCDTLLKQPNPIQSGFNPRICKRCDVMLMHGGKAKIVSIHASVKDATEAGIFLTFWQLGFNPRICKRCDKAASFGLRLFFVSIHASVKDATFLGDDTGMIFEFQSTHL